MNTFKLTSIIAASLFSASVFAAPININTADAPAIDAELVGVGPVIAERVVAYRDAHGAFTSKEQLTQVKGIGQRTIEKNAENILLK